MIRQWSHEAQIKQGPAAVPIAVAVVSTVVSQALAPKAPKAPKVTEPTVMPTEDSELVREAKRRSLVAQANRGGRASTILSDTDNNTETFGGN